MRKVYEGNGFIIETNDSDEIFVGLDEWPRTRLRIGKGSVPSGISVSWKNESIELIPIGYKEITFRRIMRIDEAD